MTKKQIAEFEQCKKQHFIVWRSSRVPVYEDAFYAWCMKERRPHIKIRTKGRFALIRLDLPTANHHIDRQCKMDLESFKERWGSYPHDCTVPFGSTDLDVPISNVWPMALQLYEIHLALVIRKDSPGWLSIHDDACSENAL